MWAHFSLYKFALFLQNMCARHIADILLKLQLYFKKLLMKITFSEDRCCCIQNCCKKVVAIERDRYNAYLRFMWSYFVVLCELWNFCCLHIKLGRLLFLDVFFSYLYLQGYFILPTVITGLPDDSRVNQEEIFGPVVTITPFSTEEEVKC